MKIKCVIFDLDGTLVDSEGLCNQAFLDVLPELDFTVEELVTRYRGKKLAPILEDIEQVIGRTLHEGFEKEYRARVAELFDSELKPMPRVHEMLASLNYPFCVASSGPPEKIRKALSISSLDSFFGDNIFSSYVVGSWKPEPGLFLHAAKTMGYDPESCAVVEDSPLGIQAAIAANMNAFRYLPHGSAEAELGVVLFDDMIELPSLLGRFQAKSAEQFGAGNSG